MFSHPQTTQQQCSTRALQHNSITHAHSQPYITSNLQQASNMITQSLHTTTPTSTPRQQRHQQCIIICNPLNALGGTSNINLTPPSSNLPPCELNRKRYQDAAARPTVFQRYDDDKTAERFQQSTHQRRQRRRKPRIQRNEMTCSRRHQSANHPTR